MTDDVKPPRIKARELDGAAALWKRHEYLSRAEDRARSYSRDRFELDLNPVGVDRGLAALPAYAMTGATLAAVLRAERDDVVAKLRALGVSTPGDADYFDGLE